MPKHHFKIPARSFDTTLLPKDARKVGSFRFREAVEDYLKQEFQGLGGSARMMVGKETIEVTWDAEPGKPGPLEIAMEKLHKGDSSEAIQLLKLALSAPEVDPEVVYNLGMALRNVGRLPEAIEQLAYLTEMRPEKVEAWDALGIAYGLLRDHEQAIHSLDRALALRPDDASALRTRGGIALAMGRAEEAIDYLQKSLAADPGNQLTYFGLAKALKAAGEPQEAEVQYHNAIELNPYNEIAAMARDNLKRMGLNVGPDRGQYMPRPDATPYLLDAIQKYRTMSQSEILTIGNELTSLDISDCDVNDLERKYHVPSLAGDYTALGCACLLYAALRIIDPGKENHHELADEYKKAQELDQASQA